MCWVCVRAQAEVSFKNVKKFFKNTRATENADPVVKPRASLCLFPLHVKHNLITNYFTLVSGDVTSRCHVTPILTNQRRWQKSKPRRSVIVKHPPK